MKNSIWKKGLTLALAAMVLTTSVSLPADAAAAAPVAETQEAQPGGEAAPAEESTPAAQVEETAPAAEAAGQTETITPETVQAAPAAEAAAQAGNGADKNECKRNGKSNSKAGSTETE